jgi:hypothetical protein
VSTTVVLEAETIGAAIRETAVANTVEKFVVV